MVWLLTIFVFLTLVGVVLTLKAVFPKRVGDTPYCDNCGHNLTRRVTCPTRRRGYA